MSNNTVNYKIISNNSESTVVAEYIHIENHSREGSYQSESDLEREFIKQLQSQAYEHIHINSEKDLKDNLRKQLEKLNNYTFTDNEWNNFFLTHLANSNQSIEEKTYTIQEDYIKNLILDNGKTKNIYILNKENIHDNSVFYNT